MIIDAMHLYQTKLTKVNEERERERELFMNLTKLLNLVCDESSGVVNRGKRRCCVH